jgi:hypothetical protein
MAIIAGVDFGTLNVQVTLLDLERGGLGYPPLMEDIPSMAYSYQTEPHRPSPRMLD